PCAAVITCAIFNLQFGKEGSHSVKIVLRKILQGMVVTFSTLEAHAQKQPSDCGRRLINTELGEHEIRGGMPKIGCRISHGVTAAAQKFSNHPCIRPILCDPGVDPVLECSQRTAEHMNRMVAEPIFELSCPV